MHDNVGHLWCHLGDHNGANALGEPFHRYLCTKMTFDRSVYPTAKCTTYKPFPTAPVVWGPIQTSPAASQLDFGLSQACYFLCLHGHLMGNHHSFEFSQLNIAQLCWMFLSLLQMKTENVKYIYICPHSLLSSSLTQLCDAAVFGPSGTCSSFAIKKACVGILLFFWKGYSWKEEKLKLDKSNSV